MPTSPMDRIAELSRVAHSCADADGDVFIPAGDLRALLDVAEAAIKRCDTCETCRGTGTQSLWSPRMGRIEEPCPNCAPLRAALAKLGGEK